MSSKQLAQTMRKSTLTKVTSQNTDILRTQSYDHLLNLRTTLLHMQYLHAYLSQKLERQHLNQQNQHKDHLIQCFNLREQLQSLRKHNFTKLFIVKLQQLLAIEENCNEQLMTQPEINQTPKKFLDSSSLELGHQNFEILSKIQKLTTFAKIQEEETQHSLCKLYIGNKVMLDLPKTAQSFEKIEQKIDNFLAKHNETINLYNQKLKDFEQVQSTYKNYLNIVKPKIFELNPTGKNDQNQQNKIKNQFRPSTQKSFLYQSHVKNRLIEQKKSLQARLNLAKNKLLEYF